MEFIGVLVDNYKTSTQGLALAVKIIFAVVLAFIFLAVISAFVNLFMTAF